MNHLHWLLTGLALAVIITGCAYSGDEYRTSEPYRPSSPTGHHH